MSVKTKLYSPLNLKACKFDILKFHQAIGNKIDTLNAVGKPSSGTYIIIGLFKAYETAEISLFKEHVCCLKSEYNKGHFTMSKELMLKIKAKYDELHNEKHWKANKKEDSPSVIAITALLGKLGNTDKKDAKTIKVDKKKTASWKYNTTIGSNNDHSTKSVLDGTNKTYKWCDGTGHGGKGILSIHEPGTCTNKATSFTSNHIEAPLINSYNMKIDETTIQFLQAILEDAQLGNDIAAVLLAILQK
jgi:hypothetical protein